MASPRRRDALAALLRTLQQDDGSGIDAAAARQLAEEAFGPSHASAAASDRYIDVLPAAAVAVAVAEAAGAVAAALQAAPAGPPRLAAAVTAFMELRLRQADAAEVVAAVAACNERLCSLVDEFMVAGRQVALHRLAAAELRAPAPCSVAAHRMLTGAKISLLNCMGAVEEAGQAAAWLAGHAVDVLQVTDEYMERCLEVAQRDAAAAFDATTSMLREMAGAGGAATTSLLPEDVVAVVASCAEAPTSDLPVEALVRRIFTFTPGARSMPKRMARAAVWGHVTTMRRAIEDAGAVISDLRSEQAAWLARRGEATPSPRVAAQSNARPTAASPPSSAIAAATRAADVPNMEAFRHWHTNLRFAGGTAAAAGGKAGGGVAHEAASHHEAPRAAASPPAHRIRRGSGGGDTVGETSDILTVTSSLRGLDVDAAAEPARPSTDGGAPPRQRSVLPSVRRAPAARVAVGGGLTRLAVAAAPPSRRQPLRPRPVGSAAGAAMGPGGATGASEGKASGKPMDTATALMKSRSGRQWALALSPGGALVCDPIAPVAARSYSLLTSPTPAGSAMALPPHHEHEPGAATPAAVAEAHARFASARRSSSARLRERAGGSARAALANGDRVGILAARRASRSPSFLPPSSCVSEPAVAEQGARPMVVSGEHDAGGGAVQSHGGSAAPPLTPATLVPAPVLDPALADSSPTAPALIDALRSWRALAAATPVWATRLPGTATTPPPDPMFASRTSPLAAGAVLEPTPGSTASGTPVAVGPLAGASLPVSLVTLAESPTEGLATGSDDEDAVLPPAQLLARNTVTDMASTGLAEHAHLGSPPPTSSGLPVLDAPAGWRRTRKPSQAVVTMGLEPRYAKRLSIRGSRPAMAESPAAAAAAPAAAADAGASLMQEAPARGEGNGLGGGTSDAEARGGEGDAATPLIARNTITRMVTELLARVEDQIAERVGEVALARFFSERAMTAGSAQTPPVAANPDAEAVNHLATDDVVHMSSLPHTPATCDIPVAASCGNNESSSGSDEAAAGIDGEGAASPVDDARFAAAFEVPQASFAGTQPIGSAAASPAAAAEPGGAWLVLARQQV